MIAPDRPTAPHIVDIEGLAQSVLDDGSRREPFDRIARIAAGALRAPLSLLTLSTPDRTVIAGGCGLPPEWESARVATAGPTLAHEIRRRARPLAVRDLDADERFAATPSARELNAAACLGVPLHGPSGHYVGSLAVLDRVPREWEAEATELLREFAHLAEESIARDASARASAGGPAAAAGPTAAEQASRPADEEVRASEERYRLGARAMRSVVRDWDLATGGLVWSEDAPALLRYTPGEMGGSIDWWYARIHPDDRREVLNTLDASIRGIEPLWSSEYRVRRGDRAYAVVLDSCFIQRDERGRATRVVGAMMDLTDRKRDEEVQRFLAHASALLDETFDYESTFPRLAQLAVPALADYCLIDLREEGGGIRRIATAHADPRRERELDPEGYHGPDSDPARHPAIRAVRTGQPVLVPTCTPEVLDTIGHEPGHRERLEAIGLRSFMVLPLAAHGNTLGALTLASTTPDRRYGPADLVTAQDLAHRAALSIEHARLYRESQEAIRARDEVLGIVSHDLRSPLNTIVLAASMLLETLSERRDENVRWLDIIRRGAAQMGNLIDDLLDVSTIEAGSFSVALSDHDTGQLLREACTLLRPLAAEQEVDLACEVEEGLPGVQADETQLLRVFSNLIGNAIKFTPRGGTITARAASSGPDRVRFSVADTGPGIPEEIRAHVFDRFWQGRRGDRRGAGLGLTIARGIVEAHGGRIWVESEPGRGTTFHFSLPVREG